MSTWVTSPLVKAEFRNTDWVEFGTAQNCDRKGNLLSDRPRNTRLPSKHTLRQAIPHGKPKIPPKELELVSFRTNSSRGPPRRVANCRCRRYPAQRVQRLQPPAFGEISSNLVTRSVRARARDRSLTYVSGYLNARNGLGVRCNLPLRQCAAGMSP